MFCSSVLRRLCQDRRLWKNGWKSSSLWAPIGAARYASKYRTRTLNGFTSCRRVASTGAERNEPHKVQRLDDQHGKIAGFERALFRRLEQAGFKRSRRFYWTVFASTSLVICWGYLYLFPHKLRQQVVEEVSTVASQSLEDEKIVTKAGQLSKDVLNAILNDDGTKVVASDFVKGVIVSDPIRNAAVTTMLDLLNDPAVLNLLRVRLSQIILAILQDESTRQIVLSQVNLILQHETIRQSLQTLLSDLTNTPEVQKLMSDFFRGVLSSDAVKNQGAILGQQVTADVISSKDIQEQAGNAIWSALKHSVIPNIFKGKSDVAKVTTGEKDKADQISKDHVGKSQDQKKGDLAVDTKSREFEIPISYDESYNRYNRYAMDDDI